MVHAELLTFNSVENLAQYAKAYPIHYDDNIAWAKSAKTTPVSMTLS